MTTQFARFDRTTSRQLTPSVLVRKESSEGRGKAPWTGAAHALIRIETGLDRQARCVSIGPVSKGRLGSRFAFWTKMLTASTGAPHSEAEGINGLGYLGSSAVDVFESSVFPESSKPVSPFPGHG